MLIIISSVIVVIILLLSIFLLIKFIRWQKKIKINSSINKDKIIKHFLDKAKIDHKYLSYIKNNIDVVNIIDNLNYNNTMYYLEKLKNINDSEQKIN